MLDDLRRARGIHGRGGERALRSERRREEAQQRLVQHTKQKQTTRGESCAFSACDGAFESREQAQQTREAQAEPLHSRRRSTQHWSSSLAAYRTLRERQREEAA